MPMIKYCTLLVLLTFFAYQGKSQLSITLDGSINEWIEWSDSAKLTTLVADKNVIISRDSLYYYIGIKSDAETIGSIFIKKNNEVQVIHASWALGMARYTLNNAVDSNRIQPFAFTFRHPLSRQPHVKTSGQSIEMECYGYLQKNGWTASMIPMGSSREVEFVLAKNMFPPGTEIAITYTGLSAENKPVLKYYPLNSSITGAFKTDEDIHRGRAQKKYSFTISGWHRLS